MRIGRVGVLAASVLTAAILVATGRSLGQQNNDRLVRLAEIEIDPAQLDAYKAALKEEIETSIRLEPGVLTLYAVSVKGRPNQIRMFKTYADVAAYKAHLETPHFRKYKTSTAAMVKSLKLMETDPIMLGAKSR